MGDHLVLYVDRLITASTFESSNTANITSTPSNHVKEEEVNSVNTSSHFQHGLSSCQGSTSNQIDSFGGEKGEFVECLIFQEEDEDRSMEIPCACSGSMKVRICAWKSLFWYTFCLFWPLVQINRKVEHNNFIMLQ